MNLSAFYQECVQKKEELKITSKDISSMSMLSQATVSRFFTNKGEDIGFSALCAIGEVLGVDMPIDKSPFPDTGNPSANALLQKIEELYEDRLYKHGKLYEQMLSHKNSELKRSEKSRIFFVGLSVALVIFICALFFIDITNPTVGWFRY